MNTSHRLFISLGIIAVIAACGESGLGGEDLYDRKPSNRPHPSSQTETTGGSIATGGSASTDVADAGVDQGGASSVETTQAATGGAIQVILL